VSVSATPLVTPAAVADRYGVGVDKVLRWIAAGELRALNVAASPEGRPRWRIDLADLAAFEERREAKRAQG
jgi:excisionase family DNA binding protein